MIKKLYLLLSVLFLIYWGCEEESLCSGDEVELWGECYSKEYTIELNLENDVLMGEIPSEIGQFSNLQILNLGENQLSGPIPPEIGNLTTLRILRLDDNYFTGSIPPEIGNLTNLEGLYLHDNQFTGMLIFHLMD